MNMRTIRFTSPANWLIYLLFMAICPGCSTTPKTEKFQTSRDNVVDVRDKVREIKIEDVLISGIARIYLLGDYLIIEDFKSYDNLIHLFDKNNFKYITSTAYRGEGPGEITNPGFIGINESARIFYVSDHGKQKIFSYELDSVLENPSYMPPVKMDLKGMQFPSEYEYINDTLCIGRIIEPIGSNDFKPSIGKWDMTTGEIHLMTYEHPEIEKPRFTFAVSVKNGIYIQSYNYHDLLTICDLDGNLRYNIYGPRWNNRKQNRVDYYSKAQVCNDKIIVTYSGEQEVPYSLLLVFDMDGNYLRTISTGYQIVDFCFDKTSNRILLNLDDEIQFAYLDLDGII